MFMYKLAAIIFVILIALSLGCSRSVPPYDLVEGPKEKWTMSPDNAVLAATEYCEVNEIDLTIYTVPRVGCDSLDGERYWSLLYDGFSRIDGDHFMLLINDETGAIEYVAGE